MSVDVSPDGRLVVFDLVGALYVVPIGGGRARPITRGDAFDAQPRFSPDGRQVAFISDRSGVPNLWIADADGGRPRRLSDVRNTAYDAPISSPAWSPDGRTIVVAQRLASHRPTLDGLFHHGRRWLLAAYDVDSGWMRWISDTARATARQALGPSVTPDGQYVYAAVEPYQNGHNFESQWRIARIDVATGAMAPELGSSEGRDALRPALSRDGRFLAYASSTGALHGIRIRDLTRPHEWWVVRDQIETVRNPGEASDSRDLVPGYAFGPGGRFLVAAWGGKLHRVEVASGRVTLIPFTALVERRITPPIVHQFTLSDTAQISPTIMQAALSPDGGRVAFSAMDRLWVANLGTDGHSIDPPVRLTSDSVGEFYPSWAPDGESVVYSTWQDGRGGLVRRAQARSSPSMPPSPSVALTTDTALYFHTACAPSGDGVAVVKASLPPDRVLTHNGLNPVPSLSVSWIPGGGGGATLLAPLSSDIGALTQLPTYFPAEQLYFTRNPDYVHVGLARVSLAGGKIEARYVIPDSESTIGPLNGITAILAPDERRALVTHRRALAEVALPIPSGNSTDTFDIADAYGRRWGARGGAALRWGRALSPWVSWAADGRRVLFTQGSSMFIGNTNRDGWTEFSRVDVELRVKPDIPQGTLVLRGARIVTMVDRPSRSIEVIERGDLIVRNNRIVSVGPTGHSRIPPGTPVLDLTGKTILPGYVDTHDHIVAPDGLHPQQYWGFLARLASGVTALRDPYSAQVTYNDVFTYADRERAGQLLSPRVYSSGVPHLRDDLPVRAREDARALMWPLAEYFRGQSFKEYDGSATRKAKQLVATAAAEAGLNATIEGGDVSARAVTAVLDGYAGLEHALPIPLYDDLLTLIARAGIFHTQTLGTVTGAWGYFAAWPSFPGYLGTVRQFVPASAAARWAPIDLFQSAYGRPTLEDLCPVLRGAAGIAERGGRIAIGSHGDIAGVGFHFEMWLNALAGMPNAEVLRAATVGGATAIGHLRDLGTLEAGKLADLQVLDENPLTDIRNTLTIRYVMKNGRLYQSRDLAEVWPGQAQLAKVYLPGQDDGAAGEGLEADPVPWVGCVSAGGLLM